MESSALREQQGQPWPVLADRYDPTAPRSVENRAQNLEMLGRVTDAELVTLYRGASAYLDPTLFEGFGYQVLEAMACGAPVVASGTTSIPEIVGDAGLLCDPADPGAFADALVRVLEEPGLAGELRRRGLERAAGFTWERAARQIAGALEEALAA